MWDKKGENLTYRFFKLLNEQQMSVKPNMSVDPAMSGPQKTTASPQDIKVARKNIDQQVKKVSLTPAEGKQAVKLAQSVVGDIIYADADKQQRQITPDGLVGPITLLAFAAVGIPKELIGNNPKDKNNHALVLRNINQIRQTLSKKYDAALPHIGVDQQKSIAAAKNTKAPQVKPQAAEPVKLKAISGIPEVLKGIINNAQELANLFIPKENPDQPPVNRLKVKKPPVVTAKIRRGRGTSELDPVMAAAVTVLQKAAVEAGFRLRDFQPSGPISGFRSIEKQKMNWKRAIKNYGKKGKYGETSTKIIRYEPGSSRPFVAYFKNVEKNGKKAGKVWSRSKTKQGAVKRIIRQFVAKPPNTTKTGEVIGGSPHMSGRAIDFLLKYGASAKKIPQMEKLPEYKWLQQNAAKYGLKQYGDEPWHWEMDEKNYNYFLNQMAAAAENKKGNEPESLAFSDKAKQIAGVA
tara:strand:+ start:3679 stop:5067 length:1389 start_codon:yes stop_codon:yes gene_type:complete